MANNEETCPVCKKAKIIMGEAKESLLPIISKDGLTVVDPGSYPVCDGCYADQWTTKYGAQFGNITFAQYEKGQEKGEYLTTRPW